MMKTKLYFLILFIGINFNLLGQQIADVKSISVDSEILNQNRELLVYLPSGYNENILTHYDVIYVFDSQNRELFDYVHSILNFLESGEKEFIVVGITSPYYEELDYARNNDMLPYPRYTEPSEFYNGYSGNADNFLDFVEKEVVQYIDSNYRTLGNNIVIGHSLSASLSLYSIIYKPNLFQDIIAISPNFAFDNERLVEDILGFDYSQIDSYSFLYTSLANEGNGFWEEWLPAYAKVKTFITDSLTDVYDYKTANFPDLNHWTTYPKSVEYALSEYFVYYSQFKNEKLSKNTTEIKITVTVPDKNDKVYITGNQENLGNWEPKELKMNKVSDFEREITLELQLPAEFKFTRGNWDTEALVENNEYMGNIAISSSDIKEVQYKIINWNDKIE